MGRGRIAVVGGVLLLAVSFAVYHFWQYEEQAHEQAKKLAQEPHKNSSEPVLLELSEETVKAMT